MNKILDHESLSLNTHEISIICDAWNEATVETIGWPIYGSLDW